MFFLSQTILSNAGWARWWSSSSGFDPTSRHQLLRHGLERIGKLSVTCFTISYMLYFHLHALQSATRFTISYMLYFHLHALQSATWFTISYMLYFQYWNMYSLNRPLHCPIVKQCWAKVRSLGPLSRLASNKLARITVSSVCYEHPSWLSDCVFILFFEGERQER